MISKNGIVSIYGFLLGLSILLVSLLQSRNLSAYIHDNNVNEFHLFMAYAAIANVLVRIINRGVTYKVSNHNMRCLCRFNVEKSLLCYRYVPKPYFWACSWLQACWSQSVRCHRGNPLDGNEWQLTPSLLAHTYSLYIHISNLYLYS